MAKIPSDKPGVPDDSSDIVAATRLYERRLAGVMTLRREDLREKHRLMARDPFSFFRATFYHWAVCFPAVLPELWKAPAVLSAGDSHVENFGTWRDAEARLVWGVNDLDEAYPLPFANDLVRLATSARLAIGVHELAVSPKRACAEILEGYRKYLESGGAPFVLEENNGWLRSAVFGREREPAVFWERINGLPPVRGTPAPVMKLLRAALPAGCDAPRVLRRRAGLGSLGRPRFTAVATTGGSGVAREAKALAPSAAAWAAGDFSGKTHTGALLAGAVRAGDPFSTVTGDWILRRLSPHCCRIDLAQLDSGRDERRLLRAMGKGIANLHLGTPGAAAKILADLDRRPADWLGDAARRMEGVVIAAHRRWCEATPAE